MTRYRTEYQPGEPWRHRAARERAARQLPPPKRRTRPKSTPAELEAWRADMRAKGYVV